MADISNELIINVLQQIIDPDTGLDIVTSGLVTGLVIKGNNVGFALDLGSDGTPELAKQKEPLRKAAEDTIKNLPEVASATVVLTAERETPHRAEPPKGPPPEFQSSGQEQKGPEPILLPNIKSIIAVASGKGGVGKSTVAVNLALGLKILGYKVGILDGDIYGPSIPRMLGTKERPTGSEEELNPVEAHGIKVISMGLLIDEEKPMIWRGPMVAGALSQMFSDVSWGKLDVLIVDMPPGTGDAQLTLAQRIPVAGAVIVSTPQDIALLDARKGLEMFKKVDVPVFGIVENMSTFICPSCSTQTDIFGHGGARKTAEKLRCEFLGEVPLHLSIRETSDNGTPIVANKPDSAEAQAFMVIAEKVALKAGL
ncbi:MAG: iron-sulfur cluster carrier protein ApbC [Sphingomonadales bacterium]|jgi:ATP-binding protein involved in chromosome partitioning